VRNRFIKFAAVAGAAVAIAALAGGAVASASSATPARPAATNACGTNCTDAWFTNPGAAAILTNHSNLQTENNLVRITQGSNGAAKEDWSIINAGTVFPLYCNLNGTTVDPAMFSNHQCQLLDSAGLLGAKTFQIAANPDNGGDENLCVGAWNNNAPVNGFKFRLVECGVNPDTVMIYTKTLPSTGASVSCPGSVTFPAPAPPASDCGWLINGASSNYSTPLVATSSGSFPSNPTWTSVHKNAQTSVDSQEVHAAVGPF
jgi:hypothetical protein